MTASARLGGAGEHEIPCRTVGEVVSAVAQRLSPVFGLASASEARELVAAAAARPRFWPSVASEELLSVELLGEIREATSRRMRGAPLAYAVRSAPFRHLSLYVDERVLIPRPETEYLVELVLGALSGASHAPGFPRRDRDAAGGRDSPTTDASRESGVAASSGHGLVAADVGTGSGAIAISLASEGSFARVIATDVSLDALAVAAVNVERLRGELRAPVELRGGDGLLPLAGQQLDLIVSNPPYIAFAEMDRLPPSVRDWEPPLALACDEDGLAVTRRLVLGSPRVLRLGGLLALEVDERRAERVAAIIDETGEFERARVARDLAGRNRFVLARRSCNP